MKVTSVHLYSDTVIEPVVLSFRDPRALNPYQVKSIIGLDADEIIPRYSGAGGSGKKHYDLALQKREVVARIALNPQWSEGDSYSDLRDDMYRLIASSRTGEITLQFNDGEVGIAKISGFVTKFEASHFTEQPEVQLTISCPDPMLRGLERVMVDVSAMDPIDFEINDALSTAPHGFRMRMKFNSNRPSHAILQGDDEFTVTPWTMLGFITGDILHFSSEHNAKELWVPRPNQFSIIDTIEPGSVWPMVFPGTNSFSMPGWVQILEVSYIPAYWGV